MIKRVVNDGCFAGPTMNNDKGAKIMVQGHDEIHVGLEASERKSIRVLRKKADGMIVEAHALPVRVVLDKRCFPKFRVIGDKRVCRFNILT
jgi:hypothetical protein